MPPISVLIKPASSQCNMSCRYCFYHSEAEKRSQRSYGLMTEQTLKNVIRRTMPRADGMISYAFQGGEPTLSGLDFFKRVTEYEQQYNKNQVRVENSLQTNGLLLDEEWCRFLADQHFLVGLSMDGTQEIHNSLRLTGAGEPTFDRVLSASEMMDSFGVDYNILTVVTPQIARHIRTVYSFYRDHGWNYQQYIVCLDPLGEPFGQYPWSISPDLYGHFLIELFDLWYADLMQDRQPFIRQFENYVAIAAGRTPESCDMRGTCSIQNVVEADGSVFPCDFYVLDDYYLGNFNKDHLEAINAARSRIRFVENSLQLTQACRACPYFRLCRGGCQRTRVWDPEEGTYKNYFCEGYRIFFEHSSEMLVEIGKTL